LLCGYIETLQDLHFRFVIFFPPLVSAPRRSEMNMGPLDIKRKGTLNLFRAGMKSYGFQPPPRTIRTTDATAARFSSSPAAE
jgi:hypothetical protein